MQRRALLGSVAALGLANRAQAQENFPNRPIRLVVPNPPGGVSDVIARALGDRAAVHLGAQVIVDNRPGGATTIGSTFVARSEPDGYTILTLTTAGLVQGVIQENLPFSFERDFAPIIGVGSFPMALAVSTASNIRSMADLTAAARSRDGVTYGSGGAGTMSHLASVRLLNELRGHGTHVPFRGNAPALQALAGGHIQMMFPGVPEVPPVVAAGHIRVLAVTSDTRLPAIPDVPTMRELGFPEFNPRLWYAFVAPARTPAPIIARLHDAFARALHEPAIQERFTGLGFSTELRGPEALAQYMRQETERWGTVVRANNLRSTD
ncbi:MAG: tripartite tricarboxylate transporter substrate binding protein [Elioraea sp.]|nr:tripartite tricarboxylate transporter substrate binding protein [Elioraea sp.]